MTQLAIILSMLAFTNWNGQPPRHQLSFYKSCRTGIDSLTKQLVYFTADTGPLNEGGDNKLTKEFERRINTNDIPFNAKNYDPNIIVAFIVDKDGSVKGERIVNDITRRVGNQMLDIIKSFTWTPAKCNGKICCNDSKEINDN